MSKLTVTTIDTGTTSTPLNITTGAANASIKIESNDKIQVVGTLLQDGIANYPIVRATVQATTSGTSKDFTGIPSWAKRITVMIQGLSGSGTSGFIVQLGTSGGVVATGYLSRAYGVTTNTLGGTTGFSFNDSSIAAGVSHGIMTIANITDDTWVFVSEFADTTSPAFARAGGSIALGGTLDRIRFTTVNGSDTFDAGNVNIMYE